jgi:hypothetical protein
LQRINSGKLGLTATVHPAEGSRRAFGPADAPAYTTRAPNEEVAAQDFWELRNRRGFPLVAEI